MIQALENSVCQYPKMEGRFAQVAGVSFGFDPTCPPYSRIYRESVKIQGEYVDLQKVKHSILSLTIIISSYLSSSIIIHRLEQREEHALSQPLIVHYINYYYYYGFY